MFKYKVSLKPISIIITTLSGQAYNGEHSLEDAITNIVDKMGSLIKRSGIRVPNPTRPEEDFTDKWKENPNLELEFERWLIQAQVDFDDMANNSNMPNVISKANKSFGIILNENLFRTSIIDKNINITPKRIEINEVPPKPHMWK
jgi:hypothetical protein